MRNPSLLFPLVVIAIGTIPLLSQSPSEQRSSFEVASIKPADPNQFRNGVPESLGLPVRGRCHGIDSKFPPDDTGNVVPLGRCRMLIGRLDNIVALAYGTIAQMIDVSGAPDWSRTSMFSIEATAADPTTTTEAQLLAMLQNLLADRFELK